MPENREIAEIAEAMILVDAARSVAAREALRVRFRANDPDAAAVQRLRVRDDAAAADMVLLEGAPTRAEVARVVARYAHVHAQVACDGTAEPSSLARGSGVAEAVLLDWAGTVAHLESAEEWISGAVDEAGIAVAAHDRRSWARRAKAAGLPGGRRPADLSPRDLAAWWRRDLGSV